MDIKKASDTELKAFIYDQLLLSNQCQANIKTVEQELASRQQPVFNKAKEIAKAQKKAETPQ